MSNRKSWKQRIEQAKAARMFTADDVTEAVDFKSCAVAEKHNYSNYDLTVEEDRLGRIFYNYVLIDDITNAERVYNEIQKLPKPTGDESVEGKKS